MTLEELAIKYKHSDPTFRPNKLNIPINRMPTTDVGAEEFNEIYKLCTSISWLREIKRTPSGGLKKPAYSYIPAWDVIAKKNSIELTLLVSKGFFRFVFRADYKDEESVGCTGREAYKTFCGICKDFGINVEDKYIENGKEVKESIPKVHIDLMNSRSEGKIYKHAYHIDINSAYMSGIAEAFPDLEEPIKYIYSKRKEDRKYKSVLNATQGFMQSEWCNVNGNKYALAHLSKAGIEHCNRLIEDLTQKLQRRDYLVIGRNTDGIWYVDPDGCGPYHDKNEGTELGQWKTDHKDCTIRFKTKGSYEFIEDGQYYPVVRGYTRLDAIKPRSEWKWGDIYQDGKYIKVYKFVPGTGIVSTEISIDEYELLEDLR